MSDFRREKNPHVYAVYLDLGGAESLLAWLYTAVYLDLGGAER